MELDITRTDEERADRLDRPSATVLLAMARHLMLTDTDKLDPDDLIAFLDTLKFNATETLYAVDEDVTL